jgi:hypothetical protein
LKNRHAKAPEAVTYTFVPFEKYETKYVPVADNAVNTPVATLVVAAAAIV